MTRDTVTYIKLKKNINNPYSTEK